MGVLDKFELRIARHNISWPEGGGFQPLEIWINGTSLLEMVTEIETPLVKQEFEQTVLQKHSDDNYQISAGDYHFLPTSLTYLPCRNLLDEPFELGIESGSDSQKSIVLGCTCGIIECWAILVQIELEAETVVWKDFSHLHRDWIYPLGPFRFDRQLYESELHIVRPI